MSLFDDDTNRSMESLKRPYSPTQDVEFEMEIIDDGGGPDGGAENNNINDGIVFLPIEERRSLRRMTKYEKAKIIGARAEQLKAGAKCLIENVLPEENYDCLEIAERELKERLIPMIISRPFPDGTIEYWRIQDFEK